MSQNKTTPSNSNKDANDGTPQPVVELTETQKVQLQCDEKTLEV